MQGPDAYEFGRDPAREQQRLAAVESVFDPVSRCLLLNAGTKPGWRCWEVGAGNGAIARWLCHVVGPGGAVLATDLDMGRFDPGDTKVAFVRHDVTSDPPPAGLFDLVHARFLLEHLPDPQRTILRLRDAVRPGGVIVLEDSAGLRLDVTPASPLFGLLAPAWVAAGRKVGWDATYGRRLMADLRAAGLTEMGGHEYRQVAPGGGSWAHLTHGLGRLRDQLIEQGLAATQLQRAVDLLTDPENMITGPPVLGAYARVGQRT